ncbi:hypothetical protein G6N76_08975 [Rhizobium daejeonense]|uniref:Pepco domain-containing protein n=1 Tax=Rhizobium daejeonense TaxID=240521 RepID=A0A6M1S5Y3_9HYPH|nr:hypothetical protein [Rhizobium daejeonense]NGO63808.1 hypothetical protein [Rhizobium daejeonense]
MTKLTIMVPIAAAAMPERKRKADEGGEEQSMLGGARRLFGVEPREMQQLDKRLDEIIGELQKVIGRIEKSPVGQMELRSVEVGLAISAEGSIGIATAGVETNITLSFERA